jgi:hypothetical protein
MDTVRYLTRDSGFLHIQSEETERYKDFSPALFFTPAADWTPPYPYCPTDVLFPVENKIEDNNLTIQSHQYPLEELLEDAAFKAELSVTDTPES